ncbi:MAG: MMPL family transporter [Actinomycetota bacterium]|nr:MMPL family transporter [Actinomycetota bacterium]
MPASRNIPTRNRRVTVRIARWSAEHPWRAIGLWLLLVIACVGAGQLTTVHQVNHLDTIVGESGRSARVLHDAKLAAPATENVLITARSGTLDTGLADRAATELADRMRALPAVASVQPAVRAENASALLLPVTMRGDPETATDRVGPLLDTTAAVQRDYPSLLVEQAGGASVDKAINKQVGEDLSTAAVFSLPVTLLILLIAFGAIIAAGVPVLLALSAVAAASGLSVLVSHVFPDSGSTSSMILLMGMAVGVDYSLFYVKRVREEHAAGRDRRTAIEIAAETSGHSVVVSGIAVLVSMLGLYLAKDAVFTSLATGSIIVVAIAVLGSLTVLPALLVKLGGRIDRPRVPVLWRLAAQSKQPRLWSALLRPALRRPGRTLAISVLAMLALALPALGLKLHSDSQQSLPSSVPVTQTLNRITAAFPGQGATDEIVVSGAPSDAAAVSARLIALQRGLAGNRLFVTGADPDLTVSADRTVQVLRVDVPFDAESSNAKTGLRQLRTELIPTAQQAVPGTSWLVGGDVASNLDYDQHLGDRLPWVVGFVVLLTSLIMLCVFRSILIAAVTAAVNLLSTGAAFGILVLVFQHSWAEGPLGFKSTGAIINWIPLFTFAVLFGLSMDYHIFLMSRIREAAESGLSMRDAVSAGIVRSAGTITSAAIVMVSVFAIFASLHMVEMKELGLGLAAAVLIDALVVRTILLPSALVLLGRAVWWPSRPGSRRGSRPTTDQPDRILEFTG